MKILKGIYYSIMFLIMAACLGILVCALNPDLTKMLAERVANAQEAPEGGTVSSEGTGLWPSGVLEGLFPGSTEEEPDRQPAQTEGEETGGTESLPSGTVRPDPGVNTDRGNGQGGYERPDTMPTETPSAVSGKTGYEPVQQEGEQIAQSEADNLGEIIASGNTGDGLVFDEEMYPYYAMLESDMKRLYHQIYANAMDLTVSFTPVVNVSVEQLKTVYEAVYNDHPELFWLDSGYYCKYLRNGSCVEISLKYNNTVNDIERAKQAFESAAQVILPGARALESDSEKERYVHDALMQMVEYDAAAPMNQSAYSALAGGRSVCAGYARAFQYLMQQLGIPCYYCTGFAGEDHAWNIIKTGNSFRNVDVTWDDTDPATYDFYNKTDREFAGTHVRTELSVYLPACAEDTSGRLAGEEASPGSDVEDWINPNPSTPLVWQSKAKPEDTDPGMTAEEHKQENLAIAGITEDEVREDLNEYYEDCLKLLTAAGAGDKQFSNVIPESLWNTLERAYSSGDFWKGYADEAMKNLGVENFVIQLQVQRLGGGYYRLYHNVYTY